MLTDAPAADLLDAETMRLIKRKAKGLVGKAGFTTSDREDIEQELSMAVLQSTAQFDPERGSQLAFVKTVIGRRAIRLMRDNLTEGRNPERALPLQTMVKTHEDSPTGVNVLAELGTTLTDDAHCRRLGTTMRSHGDAFAVTHDIETVLADLPDDLRDICERLKHVSPDALAREKGIPRHRMEDILRELRDRFEEAGFDGPF